MNTLNKTQVNRLANCLELAKIKHGKEKYYGKEYDYYINKENTYYGIRKDTNVAIYYDPEFNSWKVEFDPMLSKTEINIILTKIEEELEK